MTAQSAAAAKVPKPRADKRPVAPQDERAAPRGDVKPNLDAKPDEGKSDSGNAKPAASKPERQPRRPPLQKQLEDAFSALALMVMATGDQYCANVIAAQAAALAEAWADLAKVNPRVDKMLRRLLTTSAWGNVILTTSATIIPIAAHHSATIRKLPVPLGFGIEVPPPPSDEVRHHAATDKPKPDEPPAERS